MDDWKIMAALGLLGVAILIGFVICIVASVSLYAKKFAEQSEGDKRRGFEVKTSNTPGTEPAVQREKDDHHG